MNSLILCEGKTDCVFLQYYMERVYGWTRKGEGRFKLNSDFWSAEYRKKNQQVENRLLITETKGCGKLPDGLAEAIKRNKKVPPKKSDDLSDDYFDKILIFTDNDEENTIKEFINKIQIIIDKANVRFDEPITENIWNIGEVTNDITSEKRKLELYIMFVPFDENGALETYLLNCISEKDEYDKEIIKKGNDFVDKVDTNSKYLNKRRLRTKAKFDVFFSVRTSAEQYSERQTILKSIDWENYVTIRDDFEMFKDFG